MKNNFFQNIITFSQNLGVFKANLIKAEKIKADNSFRSMCVSNACGMYGRCYMCPPDVGPIDGLMTEIKNYEYALVYQTVTQLEDGYDFEGMIEAKKEITAITQKVRTFFTNMGISKALYLGPGGCGVCEKCAKQTGVPCRYPNLAIPSLEAYGINVSQLAKDSNMKYINGQDTVTYFSAVLFSLKAGDNERTN